MAYNCRGCHNGGSCHVPCSRRLGQKDHEVETSLDSIVRPCLGKREVEDERKRRRKRKKSNVLLYRHKKAREREMDEDQRQFPSLNYRNSKRD